MPRPIIEEPHLKRTVGQNGNTIKCMALITRERKVHTCVARGMVIIYHSILGLWP